MFTINVARVYDIFFRIHSCKIAICESVNMSYTCAKLTFLTMLDDKLD
jgi:hypothetical protein